MNPFISFCLYVAARVFVQYLKSRPDDSQTGDSLRFLLSAMNALKKKNPLTESFLVQLDVDLEGLGMRSAKYKSVFAYSEDNVSLSVCTIWPYLGLTIYSLDSLVLKHRGLDNQCLKAFEMVYQSKRTNVCS